jgi:hypothetical protein
MRSEESDRSGMTVKIERSTQSDDSDVGKCKDRCASSLEIDEGRLL